MSTRCGLAATSISSFSCRLLLPARQLKHIQFNLIAECLQYHCNNPQYINQSLLQFVNVTVWLQPGKVTPLGQGKRPNYGILITKSSVLGSGKFCLYLL